MLTYKFTENNTFEGKKKLRNIYMLIVSRHWKCFVCDCTIHQAQKANKLIVKDIEKEII